jgi:hypothetical protein
MLEMRRTPWDGTMLEMNTHKHTRRKHSANIWPPLLARGQRFPSLKYNVVPSNLMWYNLYQSSIKEGVYDMAGCSRGQCSYPLFDTDLFISGIRGTLIAGAPPAFGRGVPLLAELRRKYGKSILV